MDTCCMLMDINLYGALCCYFMMMLLPYLFVKLYFIYLEYIILKERIGCGMKQAILISRMIM